MVYKYRSLGMGGGSLEDMPNQTSKSFAPPLISEYVGELHVDIN